MKRKACRGRGGVVGELTFVRLIPLRDRRACRKLFDMAQISETLLIDQVVQRLTTRYADLPPEHVAGAVQSAHARFEQCPIREFVPLLVERRARAELSRNAGLLAVSS
ncbi:hypothetical protein MCHLDSM_00497 [Mycolicibacterium chlorophenolicum]|uniref:Uncharacterized protein n=2 Tax=Mycolicibacterium TaxID=1866885 RepID=A0A0J6WLV4_9MYCO|nr:hypothetical protein MCHLDSM_00497 [Mycolicibacterium chlorophenolicum]